MLSINYSNFRQNLKSILDQVNLSNTPMLITRSKGDDVVILSKSDFDSMEETFYLLKSPKNAERLLESIKQLETGRTSEKELIEE